MSCSWFILFCFVTTFLYWFLISSTIEPGCCDEEKHEEEEEESYDKAPVNDADDDNYGDEDYDNDDDEDVHPGRRLGEPREPNVQNTDDVINEAVETPNK